MKTPLTRRWPPNGDSAFSIVTDFPPPGYQGNPEMKLPTFVRKTMQAAPVRSAQMFDDRPSLPAGVSSQDRPRGSVAMPDLKFASRLPEHAQKILTGLAYEAFELSDAALSWEAHRADLRDAIGHAKARLSELHNPLNSFRGHSDAAIADQQKIIGEFQAELAHVDARRTGPNEKYRTISQLIEAARELVRKTDRNTAIASYSGAEPSLKKNEALSDAIEARRRRLRELLADLNRVRVAPFHSSAVKADARGRIEALVARGRPDLFNAVETGGEIVWPTTLMLLPDGSLATVFDALGFDCWLRKDAIIAAIEREIDATADDANALSDVDRAKALAQIERDKLAITREEVAFVNMANAQGGNVLFRGDTDIRALLGLSDDLPAPRHD
jgi:hypothetical protein